MTGAEVSLLIGGAGIIATALGAAMGYGALNQRVSTHDRDLERHDEAIRAAAAKAEHIPAMVKSIENLGDAMTKEVAHIIARMDQNNTHVHEQLADIKEQIKSRRRAGGQT